MRSGAKLNEAIAHGEKLRRRQFLQRGKIAQRTDSQDRERFANPLELFMEKVKSCGVICFTKTKKPSFLLMKRSYRYDLPKGHIEPGETELQCALRELFEETGITKKQVCLELDFRFRTIYYPRYRRFGGDKVEKSLVIFFGWVREELEIVMTEHSASEWIEWNPPHYFHNRIIDELLVAVEQTLKIKQ